MKFITNTGDYRKSSARDLYTYSSASFGDPKLRGQEWQNHVEWILKHIVGPPQATEHYSQQELERMGMIGIYASE